MTDSLTNGLFSRLMAGDQSAIGEMLTNGVDLSIVSSSGRTPLMLAASEGLNDILVALLNSGAPVNAAGEEGMTALHEAASNGHTSTVLKLIGSGAIIDAETLDGITPLMCAAAWGHVDAARVLLEHGADIERCDKRGGTAYDIACEKGENRTADFLKEIKRPLEGNS